MQQFDLTSVFSDKTNPIKTNHEGKYYVKVRRINIHAMCDLGSNNFDSIFYVKE